MMTNIKIGKPFTPSTIVKTEEIQMTEITISCGGGMGDSCWEVYTKDNFDLNNKFITINTNKDKNNTINTYNIVQTRPVKIVKVAVRNDGHNSIYGHPANTIQNYYYLVEGDYKIVDDYTDNSSLNSILFTD